MKRLLFALAYRDLALIVSVAIVFYPLNYIYTYTLDPVFYLKVGSLTTVAYLLLGGLLSGIFVLLGLILRKLLLYKRQLIVFKIEAIILLTVLIISPLLDNDPLIENVAMPFMITFAALSAFVLRTLRDPMNKEARKYSLKISLYILIAAILLNNTVIQTASHLAYNAVPDISKMRTVITRIAPIISGGPPPRKSHNSVSTTHSAENLDVIKIILILLICSLCLFLLILIVRKIVHYYRRNKNPVAKKIITDEFYIEKREFIKLDSNNPTNKKKAHLSRDYKSTVRACYAKFMNLCKKREIAIRNSDTTRQINGKYERKYPSGSADALRDFYLKVRYSDAIVDQETAEQSVQAYKKIKNHSKD